MYRNAESVYCTPETNRTLYVNDTGIKKKKETNEEEGEALDVHLLVWTLQQVQCGAGHRSSFLIMTVRVAPERMSSWSLKTQQLLPWPSSAV